MATRFVPRRKASVEQKRTVSGKRTLVPWEGGTPGKTKNSEYEKRAHP